MRLAFFNLFLFVVVGFGCNRLSNADVISVNFNNTTDPSWVLQSSDAAGPLASINWNNTSTSSGGSLGLVNDQGVATGAALTWASSNTWTNGDNNGNPDRILLHPYLDDGAGGVSITVTNIPYTLYRVYGIVSSDQNGNNSTYTTLDFTVNGNAVLGGTATAAGDYDYALNNFSSPWQQLTTTQVGNYWLTGTENSNTLTISAPNRIGAQRGSISGFVIEELDAIPEPFGGLGFTIATLGLLVVRRRR